MVAAPAGPLVELGEFLLRAGEADFEALDLAEPAFVLGLGDAGQQALADLGDPPPLGWIGSRRLHRKQLCSWAQLVP